MNPMAVFHLKNMNWGLTLNFMHPPVWRMKMENSVTLGSKRKQTGAFENAEVINKHGNSQVTVILLGIRRP